LNYLVLKFILVLLFLGSVLIIFDRYSPCKSCDDWVSQKHATTQHFKGRWSYDYTIGTSKGFKLDVDKHSYNDLTPNFPVVVYYTPVLNLTLRISYLDLELPAHSFTTKNSNGLLLAIVIFSGIISLLTLIGIISNREAAATYLFSTLFPLIILLLVILPNLY
jgi:hypothetical protein